MSDEHDDVRTLRLPDAGSHPLSSDLVVAHMPQRPSTFSERRRLYLTARLIVKRYYRSELTVESVAKAIAISPRQLQRIYAQFGDITFHNELVGRRLEAAARLLSTPSITVRDVAQQVGFHQSSHFARAFRRRYGVSPSTYRAKLDRTTSL